MKKIVFRVFLSLGLAGLISACAYQSPYVGRLVDTRSGFWCKCAALPASCHVETEYFVFDCRVSSSSSIGESIIRGTTTYTGKGGFSRLGGGSTSPNMPPTRFIVITAKNGIITGSFPLSLQDDNLNHPIAFDGTIKTRDFDAIAFDYGGTLRD
jgi:hypothetical protein